MKGKFSFEEVRKILISEGAKIELKSLDGGLVADKASLAFKVAEEYLYRFGEAEEICSVLRELKDLSFGSLISVLNINAASNAIYASNDAGSNYYFATSIVPKENMEMIEKHYDKVLESGNGNYIMDVTQEYFLLGREDKFELCQQSLLAANCSPVLYYRFAKKYENADIKALGQKVIDSKDLEYNAKFAGLIGADFKAHEQVVLEEKNPDYCLMFAKYYPNANIKAHQQVVMDHGSLYQIGEFAATVENADIAPLQEIILWRGGPEHVKDFAMCVKDADIPALEQRIIGSREPYACYQFALDVKGADVNALAKVVLDSKDPQINYEFARYIKGADKMAHAKVVWESKNEAIITAFNCYIKEFGIKKVFGKEEEKNHHIKIEEMKKEIEDSKQKETRTK